MRTDLKIDILASNIKQGKYNNSFLKLKIDNKGYITDFTCERKEILKGDEENGEVKDNSSI